MSELIGRNVGQYQIVEQIGRGGMAAVYKAYQYSIDRYVAVKILPSQFAQDPNFVKRFEHEAKAIAALEHPHILPVHDFGMDSGLNYMVMRYVEGGTLADLMRNSMPLQTIVKYIGDVARALDYAHQQGVVHRDIKPSNILIDQHGEVLLTDFGIAKIVEGSKSTQLTADGNILGTPAYMAPEQAQGTKVDGRSDIYSLGVVLYELLTGRPPYEAETPFAVALKHITEPLPPPRQIKPDIPETFEKVVLKAMAKNPDQRYETAAQLAQTLQAALTEAENPAEYQPTSITSRPKTLQEAKPKTAIAKPAQSQNSMTTIYVAGAIGLILLCIVALGGYAVFTLMSAPEEVSTLVVSPPAVSEETEIEQLPLVANATGDETDNAIDNETEGETNNEQQPPSSDNEVDQEQQQQQTLPSNDEANNNAQLPPSSDVPENEQPPPPPPGGQDGRPPPPPGERESGPPPPPPQDALEESFVDDFSSSDQHDWLVGYQEDAFGSLEAQYEDGFYNLFLRSITPDDNFYGIDVPSQEYGDFVVVIDIAEVDSTTRDFAYGLTFRSDFESGYQFEIEEGDLFSVGLETSEDIIYLIEPTESSVIRPDGPNRMSVEAIGPRFRFFINDELVATLEDFTLRNGTINLSLGLFEEGELFISYDNISILKIVRN